MKKKLLDQKIIDAYENYIWNVNEAVRFVEMGSGKIHQGAFDILKKLLKQHEEDLWKKIGKDMEDEISKSRANQTR